jgi:hypothetical protein
MYKQWKIDRSITFKKRQICSIISFCTYHDRCVCPISLKRPKIISTTFEFGTFFRKNVQVMKNCSFDNIQKAINLFKNYFLYVLWPWTDLWKEVRKLDTFDTNVGRCSMPSRNSSQTFIFVPALPAIHILGLAHGVECLTFALVSIRGFAFAAWRW